MQTNFNRDKTQPLIIMKTLNQQVLKSCDSPRSSLWVTRKWMKLSLVFCLPLLLLNIVCAQEEDPPPPPPEDEACALDESFQLVVNSNRQLLGNTIARVYVPVEDWVTFNVTFNVSAKAPPGTYSWSANRGGHSGSVTVNADGSVTGQTETVTFRRSGGNYKFVISISASNPDVTISKDKFIYLFKPTKGLPADQFDWGVPVGNSRSEGEENGPVDIKIDIASMEPDADSDQSNNNCGVRQEPGMANYAVNPLLGSVHIRDTPLSYTPSKGPAISHSVSYSHLDENYVPTDIASNFGPKWQSRQIKYVKVERLGAYAPAEIICYQSGWGLERHYHTGVIQENVTENDSEFNTSYSRSYRSQAAMVFLKRDDGDYFIRYASDDSREYYKKIIDNGGQPYYFLTAIKDAQGNELTLDYTASSTFAKLSSVTDATGKTTNFAYTNPNYPLAITKMTDPYGRSADFTYDAQGRLSSITDPVAITSSFTYDPGNPLVVQNLTTPYGTTSFQMESGEGYHSVEVTRPDGSQRRWEYQDTVDPSIIPASDPEVPSGEGIFVDNRLLNRFNTFYWDEKALELAQIDGDALGSAGFYQKATITRWMIGPKGLIQVPASMKKPLQSRTWYTYRSKDGYLFNERMSHNNEVAKPVAVSRLLADGSTQVTRSEYNYLGNPTKTIDPLGRETHYTYSKDGYDLLEVKQKVGSTFERLQSITYNNQYLPIEVIDASGQKTTYTYNLAGQVATITNALNQITTYNYSSDGYLTIIDGPLPGTSDVTNYTYYQGNLASVTDSEGYTMSYEYDALDRPIKTIYPDGSFEETIYDHPAYPLDPYQQMDRQGRVTTLTYNSLRQMTQVQDAQGNVTQYDYCGCGTLTQLTDANNNITTWETDIQKRITAKIYHDGKGMTYTYDELGRLATMTDALGQIKTYSYNLDNTLKKISHANEINDTGDVNYVYDTDYNRVLSVSQSAGPANYSTSYTYYPVNGQLGSGQLHTIDGPLGSDVVAFAYDPLGRVINRTINGSSRNEVATQYDDLGRVRQITNPLGTFDYNYVNATGRLSQITNPNGQTTHFTYYGNVQDQRLQTIHHRDSGSNTLSRFDYGYDLVGNITAWTRQLGSNAGADSSTYSFGYDEIDQLTSGALSAASVIEKEFGYRYDALGNRLDGSVKDASSGQALPTRASYNELNQMTERREGRGQILIRGKIDREASITVDGNPVQQDAEGFFQAWKNTSSGTNTFNVTADDGTDTTNQNYQFTRANTGAVNINYQYDDNGNLRFEKLNNGNTLKEYLWDAENRLITIRQWEPATSDTLTTPTKESRFTYDAMDRRIRKIEYENGSEVLRRHYLWVGSEIAEKRGSNSSTEVTKYFPQGYEDELANDFFYYTRDHLGSIREVIAEDGVTVLARYDYDPYGNVTALSGSLSDSDFLYTGHCYHEASGLHLAQYRAYDANTGRWISRDPIEEGDGPNMYAYVGNGPANWIDPNGKQKARRQYKDFDQKSRDAEERIRQMYPFISKKLDLRHCIASCELAKQYGEGIAKLLVAYWDYNYEIDNVINGADYLKRDSLNDMALERDGLCCKDKSCSDCCAEAGLRRTNRVAPLY